MKLLNIAIQSALFGNVCNVFLLLFMNFQSAENLDPGNPQPDLLELKYEGKT